VHDFDRVTVGDRDDLAGEILRSGEEGEGGQDEKCVRDASWRFIG